MRPPRKRAGGGERCADMAAQGIAGEGGKAFLAAHTWDHRAQSIVGWLNSLSD